jgi:hypothetical protein
MITNFGSKIVEHKAVSFLRNDSMRGWCDGTIGTRGCGIGVGCPDDHTEQLLANLQDKSFGSA